MSHVADADRRRTAVVIGAGIVGASCAWYLHREGFAITLVDSRPPGQGASYGNGAVIAVDSVQPTQYPGVLRDVPRMLMDPDGYLSVRWRHLPRLMPWLARFVWASRPATWERLCGDLAALSRLAIEAYRPLRTVPGADALINRNGWMRLFMTEAGWQKGQRQAEVIRRHGVAVDLLSPEEIRQLEPAVSREAYGAIHNSEVAHLGDPARFTACLADDVLRQGGTLVRDSAVGFDMGAAGPAAVRLESGEAIALGPQDVVVIAAGAWSRTLAAALGHPVPLDTERGYHVMVPDAKGLMRMPVLSGDWGFVCTPLDDGLRIAGTVELASLDADPNYARLRPMLRRATRMLPDLADIAPDEDSRWLGFRPSLPDSLPVISASDRHRNVFFAFGHQHLGVTLGPVTGQIIAALATGAAPVLDPAPYRIDRF